jgi:hypothetical protein
MGSLLVPVFILNLLGVGAAFILALLPTKFQQRYCTNCKAETKQFMSKKSRGIELPPIVTKEYVCDSCGSKNVERYYEQR